jgi:hypothetical protein
MVGEEGLWPLKINPSDGKSNRWNTSAMSALRVAETGLDPSAPEPAWIRLISKGEYRIQVSGKTMGDTPPRFTDRKFQQLVNEAFPSDRVVSSLDHPIWDELANGRTK